MRQQPFEQYLIGVVSVGLILLGILVTLLSAASGYENLFGAGAVLIAVGVIGIVVLVMLSDAP